MPAVANETGWRVYPEVRLATLALYAGLVVGAAFWGMTCDVVGRRLAVRTRAFDLWLSADTCHPVERYHYHQRCLRSCSRSGTLVPRLRGVPRNDWIRCWREPACRESLQRSITAPR